MKNITSNRIVELFSTLILIKKTIFYLIFHDDHGGAIYLDNSNLNSQINFCCFDQCISLKFGGGILILKSNKSLLKKLCFINCNAQVFPGFFIYGNLHISISSEINFTSVNNPNLTIECSTIISYSIKTYHNNVSNSNTNYESCGFYMDQLIQKI